MNLENRKSEMYHRMRQVEGLLDTVGTSIHKSLEECDEARTKAVIDPSDDNKDRLQQAEDTLSELNLREHQRKDDLQQLKKAATVIDKQIRDEATKETARKQVALQKILPTEYPKAEIELQKALARFAVLRAAKTGIQRQDYAVIANQITLGVNKATFQERLADASRQLDGELS